VNGSVMPLLPMFSVATPLAPTAAVPIVKGPRLNVTVPVGWPAPGARPSLTVAPATGATVNDR